MGAFGGPDIITDGLVYAIDPGSTRSYPGSGTIVNNIVGTNTATLLNGVVVSTSNGGNFDFDGSDDNINCGIPITFTATFSMNFFFKTTSSASTKLLFGMYNGSGADWWIGTLGGGTFNFSFGSPTKSDIASTTTVTDGSWHMGTCVYDSSVNSIFLYIDGSLENSSNTIPSSVTQPGGNMRIGRFGDSAGFYWPGNLANLQIYNRALSAAEISQNYNAQKNRFI